MFRPISRMAFLHRRLCHVREGSETRDCLASPHPNCRWVGGVHRESAVRLVLVTGLNPTALKFLYALKPGRGPLGA